MSCNLTIYSQNYFSFSVGVEQYELEYWFFKKFYLKNSQKNGGLFHIVLEEKSQKITLTIIESQKLPNLQNLDVDSQISHFEWILHNDRRKIIIGYTSDTKKIEVVENRRNRNQWKNNQS